MTRAAVLQSAKIPDGRRDRRADRCAAGDRRAARPRHLQHRAARHGQPARPHVSRQSRNTLERARPNARRRLPDGAALCRPGADRILRCLRSANPTAPSSPSPAPCFPALCGRPRCSAPQGVAPGAHVHPTARLESGVMIDPGVVVGPGAEIGAGTDRRRQCGDRTGRPHRPQLLDRRRTAPSCMR